ncbi:MAG: PaaI family thioesterase [Actinobacteria bacterium]|nr:PaaI family thioesterase [Actinomycetota bacterium]
MDEEAGPGLDERYLSELRERIARSEFHGWVGIKLGNVGEGTSELTLDLEPHHFNPQRIVHGGIISLMADTAIGVALRSRLASGFTHRTAQLNVHFLRSSAGGRVVARGRALHSGKRMGYGEAEVLDAAGSLLARASATFIVLPAPGAF